MEHQAGFLAGFILYLLAMMAIGWWASARQRAAAKRLGQNSAAQQGEDFLLGGRSLPFWLTLGTTVATMVGTGSSMGAVGYAYHHGWAGTLYGLGGAVGILLLAWWFAPLRALRFMTMSEELSYYVGADAWVKNLVGLTIFIACIGWLGAHILGGSMYLAWLTGIDQNQAKLLIAFGFTVYVMIGGYTAVVWTDAIQALILFAGFVLMAVFALDAVGGWQPLQQSIAQHQLLPMSLLPSLSLALAILVGVLATPSFRQRIYSGVNVATVRRSFIWSGALYLGFCVIPALLGAVAWLLDPSLQNPAYAFPYLALELLPWGLGVLVLLAGISATMSSASSDAIAAVTVLLRDLYALIFRRTPAAENVVRYSRFGLAGTVALALSFALLADNIISYITGMIAMLMSGMCVVALLGRFWLRFNRFGALTALTVAPLVSLAVILQPHWLVFWGNPVIPAVLLSAAAAVVVSLLTPPVAISRAEALSILAAQRAAMEGQSVLSKTNAPAAELPKTQITAVSIQSADVVDESSTDTSPEPCR
ncbi:MAG: sodium:solute symporter family protein [Gammaproteobacteria bacterium]|nr:sodium:solute symporter family protein [Gammaproteobacteria bacterium]